MWENGCEGIFRNKRKPILFFHIFLHIKLNERDKKCTFYHNPNRKKIFMLLDIGKFLIFVWSKMHA